MRTIFSNKVENANCEVFMKKVLFLCFFLFLISTTFAQEIKTAQLSPEKLKLRQELESDQTMLEINCDRFDRDKNIQEIQKENSRIKLLLYKASQTSNKTVKARRVCSSVEGTVAADYLIVENGKISFFIDYSRDRFGGFKFDKYDCANLNIGTYEAQTKGGTTEMVFTPFGEKDLDGKTLSLQCKTESREFVF